VNKVKKDDLVWKAVALAAGAASAAVTRWALRSAWRGVEGGDPPVNPAARSTTWSRALVWAVASGVALAVTRLVAQRGAAAAWKARTGTNPPGLEATS
jgi:hypothetical protein